MFKINLNICSRYVQNKPLTSEKLIGKFFIFLILLGKP
jgi:hypothetical protein